MGVVDQERASASAAGAVAVWNKGFRGQRLCQIHTEVAGPVLVPPMRLRCGQKASKAVPNPHAVVAGPVLVPPVRLRSRTKASTAKGYPKPIRKEGNGGKVTEERERNEDNRRKVTKGKQRKKGVTEGR